MAKRNRIKNGKNVTDSTLQHLNVDAQKEYDKKIEAYLKKLDNNMATSSEAYKLSSQDFDKQIVYIAGGGIALTIGFLKEIIANSSRENMQLMLGAWVFFGLALFANLFSYKKASESYDNAMSLFNHYRDSYENEQDADDSIVKKLNNKIKNTSNWIHILNWICLITVGLGITSLITFSYKSFVDMPDTPNQNQPQQLNKAVESDLIKGMVPPSAIRATPPPPPVRQDSTSPSSTEKK